MKTLGVAISSHNSANIIGECLSSFSDLACTVVLHDSSSTDGTTRIARRIRPDIVVIEGNQDQWWGEGTHIAMEKCFSLGCSHAVMLNPDVIISSSNLLKLLSFVKHNPMTIASALVLDKEHPKSIAWAGSIFGPVPWFPAAYCNRYIAKRGSQPDTVGAVPYKTSEVHGRGVIVSRQNFQLLNGLDYKNFPHYGCDVDFSFRANSQGISLFVIPAAKVMVASQNSGMTNNRHTAIARIKHTYNILTKKKNGDIIRVWSKLLARHAPPYAFLPSLLLVVTFHVIYHLKPKAKPKTKA